MTDPIWHYDGKLIDESPEKAIQKIVVADLDNYSQANSELAEQIKLLDDFLALHFVLLQQAVRRLDEWKRDPRKHAAFAMSSSTHNYLLLIRHAVLLGYYQEARGLFRDCHERFTRCLLFSYDLHEAERFLAGKDVSQRDVDKKLAEYLTNSNDENAEVFKYLRQDYTDQSWNVHPFLQSFRARTDVQTESLEELSEKVGINTIYGGVLATAYGRIALLHVTTIARNGVAALRTLGLAEEELADTRYRQMAQQLEAQISRTNKNDDQGLTQEA